MPEGMKLSGRTALVTGAARRIGRAISLALAERGVNLVLHARNSVNEAEALAGEVRALGVRAWIVAADLAGARQVDSLFARALEAAGHVDFLINNASIFEPATLAGFSFEELAENVQVNAFAPLQLARAFAAQGRAGAVVNILDTRVTVYDREHIPYHLSKRMLLSLTSMMALEYAPGVRVNAVAPGLILPPAGEDRSYLERLASSNPLKRIGSTEDVTRAVLFLLESDFVTGEVVFVDGGYHLKGRMYE